MNYYIKRDLNEYGPYSLADLQRYVSAGNILLTDMTRSEGMTDWVPVSQVIGTIPVAAPAIRTQPAAPAILYPEPPSLHWGIVLALGFITCGLFGWVWAFVQAGFVKKVDPSSKALLYYALAVAGFVLAIVMNVSRQFVPLAGLIQLTGTVLFIGGAFSMRGSLEEHYNSAEPIGLTLSGVMTFFFNIYYFQYHLTRIAEAKKAQQLSMAAGA